MTNHAIQKKSDKRSTKSADKLTVHNDDSPGSSKCRPCCSNRIIQLALPNLHIVSSVLKEHFKTLSRSHIDRLEKLMDQIKTTKDSMSQLNFIENIKDFKECDKMKIVQVLNEVHGRKSICKSGDSWKTIRLLPVKSSSDSFLIRLNKKNTFYNHSNKSDKSSTDSSSNLGTYTSVFKKAIGAMHFNYRETVFIKVEGIRRGGEKNSGRKNTKSVQTENSKLETFPHETCTPDVTVLYLQNRNPKRKSKLRQLHTLLEKSDFIKDTINKECTQTKVDKDNQELNKRTKINEDLKVAMEQLLKFQIVLMFVFKFLVSLCLWFMMNLQEHLKYFLTQVSEANDNFHIKSKIFQCIQRMRENLATGMGKENSREPLNSEEFLEHEHRKKAKKRKQYYTQTYHFSNIASILH